MGEGPFHIGEIDLQMRSGERETGARNGRFILDHLPANAAAYLADQRTANIAITDDSQRTWSFFIASVTGFARVADATHLVLDLAAVMVPSKMHELLHDCALPRPIGMVFIDLARGRRFRVNGRITDFTADQLSIAVEQTCPNCPKYIQKRTPTGTPDRYVETERKSGTSLSSDALKMIVSADTIFTASRDPAGTHDASHRGGNPGFISVEDNRLTIPDYIGNSMFMTLGNFQLEPAGGLTVVDFEHGRQLNLAGHAAIDFSDPTAHDGSSGRFWTFDVEEWNLEAFRPDPAWVLTGLSRFNPPTGK